ncbi:MAG TPA: hypothetical protein VNA69_00220 [Thermoanaerobaculia bacterium]|nr:hypothetical protein [Thermoanaerobaculia bacterium]
MTPTQKRIFIALAVLIALTRFLAIAEALFDWDEALFILGVREYDVVQHHPHPPGYPLYIAAAKAIHLLGVPEFRSLQVIVFLGAIALFPVIFFLAKQIGFDFTTSICGAALFAFLPNVWVYGGTGFSDVPSTALGLLACALLLRGRTDGRAYLLGAIVLGIAAGFRPPSLMIGAVPALIATWHQRRAWRRVLLAMLLGGAIAAGSYAGAALASGSTEGYVASVRAQSKYVREVDSYHNPTRAPLRELTDFFFVAPVRQQAQMTGLALLALLSLAAGIVKRRAAPLLTFAIFAPFALFAWLNLDFEAAGRYAISYMAAHALLAADGLGVLAARRARVQAVLGAMTAAVLIVWAWPALRLQRGSAPPPVAAIRWAKEHASRDERIFIYSGLGPLTQAELPDDPRVAFFDTAEQISLMSGDAWIVDLKESDGAQNFIWSRRNPLWKIVRRRCFEASAARASSIMVFGEGWYGQEGTFRWMNAESVTQLPVLRGSGTLRLALYVPVDSLPSPPAIEVWMNGALVERFVAPAATIDRTWTVPSRADAPNELRIRTSAVANPAKLGRSGDSRDLGLRVDALTWSPIE